MKKLLSIVAVSVFALSANAGTLDDVKNRGFLKCGVTTGLAGFAAPGEIDMLARNTTWTLPRDVNLGFEFVGVNFMMDKVSWFQLH